MRFIALSVAIVSGLLVSSPSFAVSDSELSKASRAQDIKVKRDWDDSWLGIVAGAYRSELNTRLNAYLKLQVVDVQLVGFKKTSDAFAGPGKRMRVTVSDGSRCLRESVRCQKTYVWKLYCARVDGSYLYSEGGCGY